MISFSVVIPTYKRHNFLKRALKNVLLQESNISEVLVVDDEKSEKCKEIVNKFKNNSHKIKKLKKIGNLILQRNLGELKKVIL